jgi:hypothetical protein
MMVMAQIKRIHFVSPLDPPPLGPIIVGLAPPVCTIVLIPIDTGGLAVPEHVGAAWSHLTWSSSSLSGVDSDGVAR